ncbi:hypothetical protein J6590_048663 [Homalodisca vitripennis]|nr:hypothetical protein J6590_048663 [Homalodisca vitripennis]
MKYLARPKRTVVSSFTVSQGRKQNRSFIINVTAPTIRCRMAVTLSLPGLRDERRDNGTAVETRETTESHACAECVKTVLQPSRSFGAERSGGSERNDDCLIWSPAQMRLYKSRIIELIFTKRLIKQRNRN